MPFIERLNHWAGLRGQHPAVVIGGSALDYAGLLAAAQEPAAASDDATSPLAIIDQPPGVGLAADFCAAAHRRQTAMVLDGGWPAELRGRLAARARAWAAGIKGPRQPGEPRPFLLGLSSGTSGLPKAFTRTASSWQISFAASEAYFHLSPDTVTLAPGPPAASMNLYALGESLYSGGTFVALPRFSPDAALAAMRENRVTRLVLVPTILELLARRGLATGQPAPHLTHIVCAGAALTPATLSLVRQWAPQAVVQQYYGAAELGFVAASTLSSALGRGADSAPATPAPATAVPGTVAALPAAAVPNAVGRAFPGVQLAILDRQGRELPAGAQGSVCVKGQLVCSGYAWGDDGLAFSAVGDGWYTVHDQGSLDAGGVLHLAGRASDMVLVSGANVYPHAVEAVMAAAAGDGLADIIVAGVADPLRGRALVAAFRHGGNVGTDGGGSIPALLRTAAGTLPASHRPSRYYELLELPLTGSGKISRQVLAQWIEEGDSRARRSS